MTARIIAFCLISASVPLAAAQHDAHDAQLATGDNTQQLSACVQSQQAARRLADAADRRLELARQTNQPVALRAAMDDLQSALSTIRLQLGSCAQLQAVEPGADPHAGHNMNMSAPGNGKVSPAPTPGTPVMPPRSTAPGPGAATPGPPAGHIMPVAAPKAPAAPASVPHAGHAMTSDVPASAAQSVDPVCGLKVDRASAPQATSQGQTYYFCSEQHRQSFTKDSAKYSPKGKQ